jgi:hypothetical protein
MRSPLLTRLERLEAGLPEVGYGQNNRYAGHRRLIEQDAIRQMSEDELRLIIGFIEAKKQGHELTSQQSAAAEAYAAALERECQKLGYKSFAALDKYCETA